MTYTIEQIRQLNLHGPQTVMEMCDELEKLQSYISHLESDINILRSELLGILKAKRESFDDTEEFFQWARNRALCALSNTDHLANTP